MGEQLVNFITCGCESSAPFFIRPSLGQGILWYATVRPSMRPFHMSRSNRLAAASDKVYQLLAHGRWFSPGTPASSTTKTGHHDIAEILLKVTLNTKNQSINLITYVEHWISPYFLFCVHVVSLLFQRFY
jgi:hypothetical protein